MSKTMQLHSIGKPMVIGILLALAQASTALAGQTPNERPAQEQTKAAPSINNTTRPQESGEKHPDAETLKISELPSISVERDRVDWLAILLNGLLVLVGSCGVFLALRTLRAIEHQARTMRRQADAMDKQIERMVASERLTDVTIQTMRETAERQLRAYVCLGSAMLRFTGSGDNESFEAQVNIKNCGQTPAYDVRQWISVFVERYPLTTEVPDPPQDFQMSAAVIPPGGTTIMIKTPQQNIRAPIVTLGNPNRTVYVCGKIRYRDAFGSHRTTTYRLFYGGNESPRRQTDEQGVVMGRLQADIAGNDAD